MKIGIFGTGNVGNTIGSRLIELGHQVMMGSRTSMNEKALAFAAAYPGKATAGTFSEAATYGELLFNCTAGAGSLEAMTMAGAGNMKGKVLIDLSNPLDFSRGMPPTLIQCNTTSLGEEIQKAFPAVNIVKTLNTMWCGLMVNPGLLNNGDHHVFMCGDDEGAKEKVKEVLSSFGWKAGNIIDLGDITAARGTEMFLPLWLRIYGAGKSASFNIKIIR